MKKNKTSTFILMTLLIVAICVDWNLPSCIGVIGASLITLFEVIAEWKGRNDGE